MIGQQEKEAFETLAQGGLSAGEIAPLARAAKAGDGQAQRKLAAAFAHAAFACPARIAPYYDAAAEGWYGVAVNGARLAESAPLTAPIPDALWRDFWGLVGDSGNSIGAAEITARTASFGGHLDSAFQAVAAEACAAYPGVRDAAAQGFPPRFTLEALAACPQGSLGWTFHRLIVDNNFDLEVLDRDKLQLARLTPPLDYVNARVLQSHDLWHIVAGYETTKLHEVAISAFQMAQFGHSYSAMFLAAVLTASAFRQEGAFALLTELTLSAWVHGRRTPPMLGIAWETLWHLPTDEVRTRCGIVAYVSPYPADLAEQFEAAA